MAPGVVVVVGVLAAGVPSVASRWCHGTRVFALSPWALEPTGWDPACQPRAPPLNPCRRSGGGGGDSELCLAAQIQPPAEGPCARGRGGISSPLGARPPRHSPASTSAHIWPQRGAWGEGPRPRLSPSPGRGPGGEKGGAPVVCPGLSPSGCSGPSPPGPALTGGRSSQCETGRPARVREPDPPGRRGRGGGAERGEGPAPAFLPHSFSRAWGPRGSSGSELCTAGARARRPSQRAGPGPRWGRFLAAALRATRCPPATMSDPAVNAQLDGIISDFEGGCWAGCCGRESAGEDPTGGPGAGRRCAEGRSDPQSRRPPVESAARPWPCTRVAYVGDPVGGPAGTPRALTGPCARSAHCRLGFLPFIVVCVCRATATSSRARGAASELSRAHSFTLGNPSAPSLRLSPAALGPRLDPATG